MEKEKKKKKLLFWLCITIVESILYISEQVRGGGGVGGSGKVRNQKKYLS